MKSAFLAMPLDLVSDAALPHARLVTPPEYVWMTSDLPHSSVEDVGVPRVYFCEPAAVLGVFPDCGTNISNASSSSPSSSPTATAARASSETAGTTFRVAPRSAAVMVTFDQIVLFDADPRRLLAVIELADTKTRIRKLVRSGAGAAAAAAEVPFVIVQYTTTLPSSAAAASAAAGSEQQVHQALILTFLDVNLRDRFCDACEQVSRAHCNIACCVASATSTPEGALDAVMGQRVPVSFFNKEPAQQGSSSPSLAAAAATSSATSGSFAAGAAQPLQPPPLQWRVSLLPFMGMVVSAPRDPSELLHLSLSALMDRRQQRDDERAEFEETGHSARSDPLDAETLDAIRHPFDVMAAECGIIVKQFDAEAQALRESDAQKVAAAQATMQRALSVLEERKDKVKSSAARYSEVLTESLQLLQQKQAAELEATVRLSTKKQEYAKELDEADATLQELYNERRWVEAESAKYSAAEYVQMVARRDALTQALHQAQRAVDAELNGSDAVEAQAASSSPNNNNNSNGGRSRSITTDASNRAYSLFSPHRVINMFARRPATAPGSPASPASPAAASSSSPAIVETRNSFTGQYQLAADHSGTPRSAKPGSATGKGGFFAANKDTPRQQNQHDPAPAMTPTSARAHRTPKPAAEGLNKPIRIDQSVQQTLHVNASLRTLLEREREGADADRLEFKALQEKVREAEQRLQALLNEQAVEAVDISKLSVERDAKADRLAELRHAELVLSQQLEAAALQRNGLFLVAEKERDEALEQRTRAEEALRQRRRRGTQELFAQCGEMLRESMRSLSEADSGFSGF